MTFIIYLNLNQSSKISQNHTFNGSEKNVVFFFLECKMKHPMLVNQSIWILFAVVMVLKQRKGKIRLIQQFSGQYRRVLHTRAVDNVHRTVYKRRIEMLFHQGHLISIKSCADFSKSTTSPRNECKIAS